MDGCIHHWVLKAPNGQTVVLGRCKKCRVRQYFPVAFPELKKTDIFHARDWVRRLNHAYFVGERSGEAPISAVNTIRW